MDKLWNNLKTTLLMGTLMGLCLAVGYLIGGQAALLPALIIGGVMNLFAYYFSDKIALATMRATEVSQDDDPALWEMVQRLSQRAGLPMPRVYVSPAAAPNAFATGRGPRHSAVCVTEGLRQMLNRDELEGVIAHELSHITHRDVLISTIAAIMAGAITWLTYMAFWGGRDRRGAELAGSPRGLARSLQKLEAANRRIPMRVPDAQSSLFIVQPLTGSDLSKLFSTHPPTEDRVARLMEMERKY